MERLSNQYTPKSVEDTVTGYWEDYDAYEAAKATNEDGPNYYFLDGPPYATGKIHLGTALNKILKDCYIRFKRMQGYRVNDTPGYDTHGLPHEVKVERNLGFDSKKDIEEYGVDRFIEECNSFVDENIAEMTEDFAELGVWMDWDDPYRTSDNDYISSVWWTFKEIYDNDLAGVGKRIINQCSRCETAIADSEVEYEQRESPSIYVEFPLRDEDASLLIWTTTPWTIPSNIYVAVDEDLEYSKVRATSDGEDHTFYVATECVEDVAERTGVDDYETLETLSGADLVGREYRHPLADEVPEQRDLDEREGVHRVYATDFVTADRTGLVHAATGHGEDDYEFGTDRDLPVFSPVDSDGTYTDEAGAYAGRYVFDANEAVIDDLDAAGVLRGSGTAHHRYGHCWRCDTPIIQNATDQWFVHVTDMKDDILEQLDESEWVPQWARDRRQRDWAENARDWCISRQRFWGIPMPVWECDEGHYTVVGGAEELRERALDELPADVDLHRPGVDDVRVECEECGAAAERIEDIFDVWFDASSAAWASLSYPDDEEPFESLWPANLVIESHDQTRGWFWGMLCTGVAIFGEIPYERVLMYGYVLDEQGDDMSKSKGNIIPPGEVIEEYGVDPLRAYLLSMCTPGQDMSFDESEVETIVRRLNVVWNSFRFPLPYMEMDGFEPGDASVADADLEPVDRWMLSRLQSVEDAVEGHLDDLQVDDAVETLLEFIVEDVSRYYVQTVRDRVWEDERTETKTAAYVTLSAVVDESLRLLAPFVPHFAERVYQTFDGSETTVHALGWPEPDDALRDETLEEHVETLRTVEASAVDARNAGERKLRWPVKRVVVESGDEAVRDAVESLESLLLDRINALSVEVVDGEWEDVEYVAEPRMDELGPAFGERAGRIAEELRGTGRESFDGEVTVDGETVTVDEEMVEFRKTVPDHVEADEFDRGTVYVDVSVDEEIEREGYASEVVRRVQEMRKDLDLDFDEYVDLGLEIHDERVAELVEDRLDDVASETRAESVDGLDGDFDLVEDWEIEDFEVTIGVSRL